MLAVPSPAALSPGWAGVPVAAVCPPAWRDARQGLRMAAGALLLRVLPGGALGLRLESVVADKGLVGQTHSAA